MFNGKLARYPELERFLDSFGDGMLRPGLDSNVALLFKKYGDEYLGLAEDLLEAIKNIGVDPVPVLQEYLLQYLRDLARFTQSGKYDNGTFETIRKNIYDNKATMLDTYLPGLFIAYGFTSLLGVKYMYFKEKFLPRIRSEMLGAEVGFGDGFYLWALLKDLPEARFHGFDISEHAIAFSSNLLERNGFRNGNYDLRFGNLCERLDVSPKTYDWCILSEVIEHVADPNHSLHEINRIIRQGGLFFMTTVKDSNHMDHISNWKSSAEVVSLLNTHGFEVEDQMEYAVMDEIECQDRAVGLSYICRKI